MSNASAEAQRYRERALQHDSYWALADESLAETMLYDALLDKSFLCSKTDLLDALIRLRDVKVSHKLAHDEARYQECWRQSIDRLIGDVSQYGD